MSSIWDHFNLTKSLHSLFITNLFKLRFEFQNILLILFNLKPLSQNITQNYFVKCMWMHPSLLFYVFCIWSWLKALVYLHTIKHVVLFATYAKTQHSIFYLNVVRKNWLTNVVFKLRYMCCYNMKRTKNVPWLFVLFILWCFPWSITVHMYGKMKSICFIHQKCSENCFVVVWHLYDLYSDSGQTRTNGIDSFIMNCCKKSVNDLFIWGPLHAGLNWQMHGHCLTWQSKYHRMHVWHVKAYVCFIMHLYWQTSVYIKYLFFSTLVTFLANYIFHTQR